MMKEILVGLVIFCLLPILAPIILLYLLGNAFFYITRTGPYA